MIVVFRDKNGILEQAVQTLPKHILSFDNDVSGKVIAQIAGTGFEVTGTVALFTDCGTQLAFHSYKELVNKQAIPLIKSVTLSAYGNPVIGTHKSARILCDMDSQYEFRRTIYHAQTLTNEEIMRDTLPVLVIPNPKPHGLGHVTVSTEEIYNNKDLMDFADNHCSAITLWASPEFFTKGSNEIRNHVGINCINAVHTSNLVTGPIPDYVGAISRIEMEILNDTKTNIKRIAEESFAQWIAP